MIEETIAIAFLIAVVVVFCAFCILLPLGLFMSGPEFDNWRENRKKKKRARRNAARRKAVRRAVAAHH